MIWLALSITGVLCKKTVSVSDFSTNTFAYCFYLTYYYEPENTTRLNFVIPSFFYCIMWLNIALCILNILISLITLREFFIWRHAKCIKCMAKIWSITILIFSCIELLLAGIFVYDILYLNHATNAKCSTKTYVSFRSSYINEHDPAPYLLQLKSNLGKMKKKVRKLKNELLFLDAIVNTKNPNYLKNPFISNENATDYVQNVWKEIFHNNIQKTNTNKTNILIPDKHFKKSFDNDYFDLDEIDNELIKNFDTLINPKLIKPIKSSNVVFGKQLNLSPNLTVDTADVLDDLVNLFLLYFNQTDDTPLNYTKNEKLEMLLDDLFEKLKNVNSSTSYNNESTWNNLGNLFDKDDDNINLNNDIKESYLLRFAKLLHIILTEKRKQAEEAASEKKLIKPFFQNDDVTNDNDDKYILQDIKFWVRKENILTTPARSNIKRSKNISKEFKQLTENNGISQPVDVLKPIAINANSSTITSTNTESSNGISSTKPSNCTESTNTTTTTTTNTTTTITTTTTTNTTNTTIITFYGEKNLIQELCDNCGYFILGPSIVCMLMSLKIGIFWLLNVSFAIVTLYYDSLIAVKRKFCNFF